jgi:glucuronoarabinoxylan endo-1,4-beta-xylanase
VWPKKEVSGCVLASVSNRNLPQVELLAGAGQGGEINTRMYKKKLIYLFLLSLLFLPSVFAQSISVNWTATHQTIDGFGAGCFFVNECSPMTSAQNTLAFDQTNGIGMSIFRYYYEPTTQNCNPTCNFTFQGPVQAAIAAGAKVFVTPMTPPPSMKSNGSNICNTGGGNGVLNSGSYAAYATLLRSFATQFQSHFGAPLYAISVQNEPNYCPNNYSGASWTAANVHDFILDNLGPTFAGSGIRIMTPEFSWWNNFNNGSNSQQLADATMTDPSAAAFVGIVAGHDYTAQNSNFAAPNIIGYSHLGNARLWQTETGNGAAKSFDLSMATGIVWAKNIHQYMTSANGNAWLFFSIMNASDNTAMSGLIRGDGTASKTFYVLGNWSKFVRPGWVRIDSTPNPQSGVYISAFKDPVSGSFAIVAVNQNSSDVTVDFSLSEFPSVSSVTPTVTSATDDLADQASATVSGGAFSYSLPATSVVTFHRVASANASKGPAAPTGLAAIVH